VGLSTIQYQPYAKQHEDSKGPGDARPTALQVIEHDGLVGKLSDKVMIVIVYTAGLGIETDRALHAAGAKLFLTVRNKDEAVIQDILKKSQGNGSLELLHMDLSNLSSFKSAATDFRARSDKLNVLINNAGLSLCEETMTRDGFEMTMGTNHFGHFLFFQLLKPTLLKSSTSTFQSRVVNYRVPVIGFRQFVSTTWILPKKAITNGRHMDSPRLQISTWQVVLSVTMERKAFMDSHFILEPFFGTEQL
jgi:hypothetical protein